MLISHWDIYVFVSFDHSIPLSLDSFQPAWNQWALFWRFCAETLISCSDIYVFVSFDHSPLFGLILTVRKTSPVLKVSCRNVDIPLRNFCFCKFRRYPPAADIYVFVSFNSSIPLFGLISTSLEMSPVLKVSQIFMKVLCRKTLISCWDIYVFVSFNHSIPLFGLISTSSGKTSPVLKVSCRNIDIPLRYLCFCKFRS